MFRKMPLTWIEKLIIAAVAAWFLFIIFAGYFAPDIIVRIM